MQGRIQGEQAQNAEVYRALSARSYSNYFKHKALKSALATKRQFSLWQCLKYKGLGPSKWYSCFWSSARIFAAVFCMP